MDHSRRQVCNCKKNVSIYQIKYNPTLKRFFFIKRYITLYARALFSNVHTYIQTHFLIVPWNDLFFLSTEKARDNRKETATGIV